MSETAEPNRTEPLEASLEALLFVAAAPVSLAQLAEALNQKQPEVESALRRLETGYQQGRGLSLQWHAGRVQLTTAPAHAAQVERFLGLEATARLSRAALETLAIIAYRQPVTRPGIDSIRGVNSDGVLKSLLSKGLVQEIGRTEGPGRPILYGTSAEFLQHFGLASLAELPPYDQVNAADLPEIENTLLKD
jgi:segregation and condensation protein B